jgi:putative ABC transport system permease protein
MAIIGVVGVVKQYGLDIDGRMVMYEPRAGSEYLVARTPSDTAATARSLVRTIHAVDPTVLVYDIRTMQNRMNDSFARQRFATIMMGTSALVALVLAAIGVYGVMSYLVTQRRRDLGVRIAFGASRGRIIQMVVRQGCELAGAGTVVGMIGALITTRVMASLLFGVSATDLVTFSVGPLILVATALLATYVPVRRATRADPMVALRED